MHGPQPGPASARPVGLKEPPAATLGSTSVSIFLLERPFSVSNYTFSLPFEWGPGPRRSG